MWVFSLRESRPNNVVERDKISLRVTSRSRQIVERKLCATGGTRDDNPSSKDEGQRKTEETKVWRDNKKSEGTKVWRDNKKTMTTCGTTLLKVGANVGVWVLNPDPQKGTFYLHVLII